MTSFVAALLGTLIALPAVFLVLRRRAVLDVPNHRSSHTTPVLRGAGIACLAGIVVATLFSLESQALPLVVIGPCVALSLVGFADDLSGVSPVYRLAVQLLLGAVLGIALGDAIWIPVAVLALPLAVNIVNFMDGINGITGFTVGIWGAAMWGAGLHYAVTEVEHLGAATLAASVAFLPTNFPAARMFLGDSGSYLFGALVGAGSVFAALRGIPLMLVLAPMVIYLADASTTLIKRWRRGAPLMEAHREHVYQKLAETFPHAKVTGFVALCSILITIAWVTLPWPLALGTSVAVVGLYLLAPKLVLAKAGGGLA